MAKKKKNNLIDAVKLAADTAKKTAETTVSKTVKNVVNESNNNRTDNSPIKQKKNLDFSATTIKTSDVGIKPEDDWVADEKENKKQSIIKNNETGTAKEIIKSVTNIPKKIKGTDDYLKKNAVSGIVNGITGIIDAPLQETQNSLEKGEKIKTKQELTNQALTSLVDSVSPNVGNLIKEGKKLKNSLENKKQDNRKNIKEKIINGLLDGFTETTDKFSQTKGLKEGLTAIGAVNNSLDDKVAKLQKTIDKPSDKLNESVAKDSKKHGKVINTLSGGLQSVGNMVPALAATYATKNPDAGLAIMAASAKGQSTKEAQMQGADLEEAIKIGNAKAALEVMTEKMTGGLNFLGKGALDDIAEKNVNKLIKNKGLNFLTKQGLGVAGEGLEEVTSDVLGTLIDQGTINPNKKYTLADLKQTLAQTGVSTLILNGLTGGYSPTAYNQNANELDKNTKNNQINIKKGDSWNTKLQDLTKVSDTVNQIQEQVQQGTITPQEGNIELQQVKNGTYDENRKLDMIVNQKSQEIQQAVQQGIITPQNGKAELNVLAKTAEQQRNEINSLSEPVDNKYNFTGNSNLDFSEQVDNWKNGKIKQNEHLVVFKETPKLYQQLGVENKPITLISNKVDRIYNDSGKQKGEYHGLNELIKQLPEAMEKPLNVVESVKDPNSIVVVTDLADKNDNIILVSLKVDKGTGQVDIDNVMKNIPTNVMTSAYGKDTYDYQKRPINGNYDGWMKKNADNNKIIYDIDDGIQKKRIEGQWLQLPNSNNSFTTNNISENNKNVNDISTNSNMQNNKNDTLYENKSENVLKITPEIKKKSAKQIADNINNGLKERSYIETATTALNSEELTKQMDNDAKVYEPHTNKKTLERAKRNLNNIKDYDSRVAYIKSLLNSNQRLTDANIAEAQLVLSEAARNKDVQNYNDLLQYTSLYATEAGQTVQALSMIKKMGPTGQLEMLRKIVSRNQALGKKAYNNVEITPEMTQKILDVYNEDGSYDEQKMFEAVDEVKQDIADQMNVSIADKLNAWRYLSMLGNPKTHIRNIVANVAMTATKDVKNTVSSATQDIFIRDKSKKTTTLAMPTKEVKNYSQIAYNEVFEELKQNKYDEQSDIESKRQIFKLKPLDKVNKFNSWALEAEDQMFKKPAFKSAFSKYLTAQGIKTQVDIENNPQVIEQAKQYALQQSLEATFQQKNSLANFINKMDNLGPGGKVARGALIPFTRTPLNIAKTGIEYTPGAGMLTTISAVKKAPSNLKAATFVDGMSKQATGASLALVGYMLAKSGILKSGGKDDKEDKYLKNLGEQDFSVTLGEKTYDLSWLSPSAMPMFVGAAMFEKLEEQENINPNVVIDTIINSTDPLSSMSCIRSFTDTLQSYGKGNASIGNAAKNMVNNYITQFIPTLSSQFATAFDDRKRMTSADKNSDFTWGDELKNQLMYKIPGLRNQLEEKTDSWGRTVYEETDTIKRAAQTFLSPATTKNKTADYLDYELLDLYKETGEAQALPAQAQKYLQYAKEKYDLSNKEFNDYKRTYGDIARTALEELVDSDEYYNADDNTRLKMVKKVYKYASYKAKKEYFDENGVDYKPQSYKTYALYDAFNIPINEVAKVDLNNIKSDKDSNGNSIKGSYKRNMANAINTLNLTVPQKAALMRKNTMYSGRATFKQYGNELAQQIVNSDLTLEMKRELLESLGYKVR